MGNAITYHITPLASVWCSYNIKLVITQIWKEDNSSIFCEIVHKWMPQDIIDDWSTLVQVVVPSGNKQQPDAIWIQIYVAI